jgi:hypothetical protein
VNEAAAAVIAIGVAERVRDADQGGWVDHLPLNLAEAVSARAAGVASRTRQASHVTRSSVPRVGHPWCVSR